MTPPVRSVTPASDGEILVDRPVAVLLAGHWSGDGEGDWYTRQVAGALARSAELHVITLEEGRSTSAADVTTEQGCTVHRLGTAPGAVAEARRAILLLALAATHHPANGRCSPMEQCLVDRGARGLWRRAEALMEALHPALILVADYSRTEAWTLAERAAPGARMVLLPLVGNQPGIFLPSLSSPFDRAAAVLVSTEAERRLVEGRPGAAAATTDRVRVVGLSLTGPTTPGATELESDADDREGGGTPARPDGGWIDASGAEAPRVVVFTESSLGAHDDRAASARLVAQALPGVAVTVVGTDGVEYWWRGFPTRRALGGSGVDARGLMAGATVTVDLRPGPLVARRALDSLLSGTPIVVPADSRARQYAEHGGGGLWFGSPGDLLWCVEALVEPDVAGRFGAEGRRYVRQWFTSRDGFEDRVRAAAWGTDVIADADSARTSK